MVDLTEREKNVLFEVLCDCIDRLDGDGTDRAEVLREINAKIFLEVIEDEA